MQQNLQEEKYKKNSILENPKWETILRGVEIGKNKQILRKFLYLY